MLALLSLTAAYALLVQAPGWNAISHYSLIRSLDRGTPIIDRYHKETGDISYFHGHFYSSKPPGLALFTFPAFKAIQAAGIEGGKPADYENRDAGIIWALGLWGVVLPAGILLFLIRHLGERVAPGLGIVSAVTIGLGTLLLPFSTLFFSHILAATLGFGAFTLLWREREGPPTWLPLTLAGLLVGFATTVEYPLALVAATLAAYALARRPWVQRALAYGTGALLGVAPLLVYQRWAFGSITHVSYTNAVIHRGVTGHDVVGANDAGLFGVTAPSFHVAAELLFAPKGLLALSPVIAIAIAGLVLLYRRGWKAEALAISALSLLFLIYDSGYWTPFGGNVPGPRFLTAILPFLGIPLVLTYRSFPVTTIALATISAALMLLATATEPLLGAEGTSRWFHRLSAGRFTGTSFLAVAAGSRHGWLTPAPLLVAATCACFFSARATVPHKGRRTDPLTAVAAILAWALVARVEGIFERHQLIEERHGSLGLALLVVVVVVIVARVAQSEPIALLYGAPLILLALPSLAHSVRTVTTLSVCVLIVSALVEFRRRAWRPSLGTKRHG